MIIVVIGLPLVFFCYEMLCSFLLVLHSLTLLIHCEKYECENSSDLLYTVKRINCENSCDLLTFTILLLRNVMQFSTCSSLSHFAIHWHTHTYTVPVGLWHYSHVHCLNSQKYLQNYQLSTVKLRVWTRLVWKHQPGFTDFLWRVIVMSTYLAPWE